MKRHNWITRDGTNMLMTEMTDNHLINSIGKLRTVALEKQKNIVMPSAWNPQERHEQMLEYELDKSMSADEYARKIFLRYSNLIRELERRKHIYKLEGDKQFHVLDIVSKSNRGGYKWKGT